MLKEKVLDAVDAVLETGGVEHLFFKGCCFWTPELLQGYRGVGEGVGGQVGEAIKGMGVEDCDKDADVAGRQDVMGSGDLAIGKAFGEWLEGGTVVEDDAGVPVRDQCMYSLCRSGTFQDQKMSDEVSELRYRLDLHGDLLCYENIYYIVLWKKSTFLSG